MDAESWEEIHDSIRNKKGNAWIQFFIDAGLEINTLDNEGYTMLSYAAEYGNMGIIDFLLENGADGNVVNFNGSKPLHLAAQFGHKDIVKLFLNIDIPVDSCDHNGCTALHYIADKKYIPIAARRKYQELILFLVHSGADLNAVDRKRRTPLLLAAQKTSKHIVEMFIKCGADVNCPDENQYTVLHRSSERGWSGIVKLLLEGKFDIDVNAKVSDFSDFQKTPLMIAARFCRKDIAKLLIKHGADIKCKDSVDQTSLHEACYTECLDLVKFFVNEGCAIDSKDSCGYSPLLVAASRENFEIVEYLIESGADVHCCDSDGNMLIHYACENGWLDLVKSLIKKGCDPNVQGEYHDTPLHISARYDCCKIIELLLNVGGDYTIENKEGLTPFQCCLIRSSVDVEGFRLFIKKGAYFKSDDYNIIVNNCYKKVILQDTKLCTQHFINKFNNADLPKVFEMFEGVKCLLPSIEEMKISIHSKRAQDVAESVEYEIQTNGFCNVLSACPVMLYSLCVRSLVLNNGS